jgi:hypothetical protein
MMQKRLPEPLHLRLRQMCCQDRKQYVHDEQVDRYAGGRAGQ